MVENRKTIKRATSPKLRFKGFKNEWQPLELRQVLQLTPRPIKMNDEAIYSLVIVKRRYEGVMHRGNFKGKDVKVKSQFLIKSNDFLISKRQIVHNACGLVPKELDGSIVSNEYAVFTPSEKLDIEYFNYFCYQSKVSQTFLKSSIGVHIEKMLFKVDRWLRYKFLFPSIAEQQKIASFLSAVDEKINHLKRKKELLEQYKKGVMEQLFSGKLRFKDDNGKEFPKWEEKRLGQIATIMKGKGISKNDIVENGRLECIRYGELYTHYSERITKIYSRTNVDKSELVLSGYNDVIIPSSGETQLDIARAACVLKAGVALGGDLNILISEQNGIFLSYYINSNLKYEIAKVAQGNSVVHLYPSQIERLKVHLPCIEGQNKIANFIGSIHDKIESVSNQITKAQTFKKGLLQQMFV